MYIVSGEMEVEMPYGTHTLTSGQFIFFPPKFRYRYCHKSDSDIDYMWLHFTGSDVITILEKYGFKLYPEINKIKNSDDITAWFKNIFNAFIKQDKFREDELSILLDRLLISLARRVNKSNARDLLLRRSIMYINSCYHANITVPELAKIENLSVSRYNALFNQVTGVSPIQYITNMRLSSACDLLLITDLPIKQIAKLVGYPDAHFFSRIFRSKIGISPVTYRKNR
jgi:AraC-like DNA-binding protein